MVFAAVIPNRLSLVFYMVTRGATMIILEIDTLTFPLILYVHYSWKEFKSQDLPEPIGRIAQTSGHGERDSSKFSAYHEKIPHTGNA